MEKTVYGNRFRAERAMFELRRHSAEILFVLSFSRCFLLASDRSNLAFQQSMRRTNGLQLLKAPFQN